MQKIAEMENIPSFLPVVYKAQRNGVHIHHTYCKLFNPPQFTMVSADHCIRHQQSILYEVFKEHN